jgi:DNA primase
MNEIFEFFTSLGFSKGEVKENEYKCLCPNHDDKHIGNFSINIDTGQFNCFACGFSGNIVYWALQRDIPYSKIQRFRKSVRKTAQDVLSLLPIRNLDNNLVKSYTKNGISNYFVKRLGDENVVSKFNVYQDDRENPILFISDANGHKGYYQRRTQGLYFLIEPLNVKSAGYFFGEHLPNTEKTILCEGFADAMYIHKVTGYKTISSMGTKLSQRQLEKLKKYQPLYVFMDGDKMGKLARKNIYFKTNFSGIYFCGGYKKDADEMKPETIERIIENARNRTEFRIYLQNTHQI